MSGNTDVDLREVFFFWTEKKGTEERKRRGAEKSFFLKKGGVDVMARVSNVRFQQGKSI